MKTFVGFFVAVLALASTAISCASAEDNGDRTIDQFTCKDIVRESGSLREVAIAFLHGYSLGKSGNSQFNLEALMKQTDAFLDRCIENPNQKAIEAMISVKK